MENRFCVCHKNKGKRNENFELLSLSIEKRLLQTNVRYKLILQAPISQNVQTHSNCLSVFDHFVGLTLKWLINVRKVVTHKPLKVVTGKTFFSSVYFIGKTLL